MNIHGQFLYPGVISVTEASYTCSRGITPGEITVRINPQPIELIQQIGSCVFGDQVNVPLVLPNCKLVGARYDVDEGGQHIYLRFLDRRWAWQGFGNLKGEYNLIDKHGKLIPWSCCSPSELTVLCLLDMGETNFSVDMPPGVPRALGSKIGNFLPVGFNFPVGINPLTKWDGGCSALYLQQLCDACGRVIVYDPISNRVMIVKPGYGGILPTNLSIKKLSATYTLINAPAKITIRGSETRYQVKLACRAVGREFDGSLRPIEFLSYAPKQTGVKQIVNVQLNNIPTDTNCSVTWTVTVSIGDMDINAIYEAPGGTSQSTIVAALIADLNGNSNFTNSCTAAEYLNYLQISGISDSVSFIVSANVSISCSDDPPEEEPSISVINFQSAVKGGVNWSYCQPPMFPGIQQVENPNGGAPLVTVDQARRYAQESVYKYFQVIGVDYSCVAPDSPVNVNGDIVPLPINVPGYPKSPLVRRQQLFLLDKKVDQITISAGDANIVDPFTGQPIIINEYNGYSRDKPAEAFGAIAREIVAGTANFVNAVGPNTPFMSHIFVDFSIDSDWQAIKFSDFVYKFKEVATQDLNGNNVITSDGTIEAPIIILETSVCVRDASTNALDCYEMTGRVQFPTPGVNGLSGDATLVVKHPDVQLNVTSTYDDNTGLVTSTSILETDPVQRANYYLQGEIYKFYTPSGGIVEYNGIIAKIGLDGALQQATWHIGGGKPCTTTISRNSEHSRTILPYPARRRLEYFVVPNLKRAIDQIMEQRNDPGSPSGIIK